MGRYYYYYYSWVCVLVLAAAPASTAVVAAPVQVEGPASASSTTSSSSYSFFNWDFLTVGVVTTAEQEDSATATIAATATTNNKEEASLQQQQHQKRLQSTFDGLWKYVQEMESTPLVVDATNIPVEAMTEQVTRAKQLHAYIQQIATLYHPENPYHNFEHAAHVSSTLRTMLDDTGTKLDQLKQNQPVASSTETNTHLFHHKKRRILQRLHDDPLLKFALLFAALIHDVDHQGVTNAQLMQEQHVLAHHYPNGSIAERHSLTVALQLWQQPDFQELRDFVCPNQNVARRFQEIVTLAVLATDIADPAVTADRYRQWDLVFGQYDETIIDDSPETAISDQDPRFIITLQHFMQAADVGATWQEWDTFTLWNERLIGEIKQAFAVHRSPFDPNHQWYFGEIAFLQGYVLPLAQHFEECCWLEGSDSGEATKSPLQMARHNLATWEEQGQDVMRRILEQYQ